MEQASQYSNFGPTLLELVFQAKIYIFRIILDLGRNNLHELFTLLKQNFFILNFIQFVCKNNLIIYFITNYKSFN